jgi:hypothetical protein
VKSLDLKTGLLFIARSRSYRSEAAPKTSAAARIVRLTLANVEVLKNNVELHAEPMRTCSEIAGATPSIRRAFTRPCARPNAHSGSDFAISMRLRTLMFLQH